MSITWSNSRDQALQACERRFYFQYLTNARINSKEEILREIAFLKKLKNIPLWKGEIFHSVIADYLRRIRQGMHPICEGLIEELRKRMTYQWAYSAEKRFRLDPKSIGGDGAVALFEHEYNENPGQDIEQIIEEVANWIVPFVAWIEHRNLQDMIREAGKVWIEPRAYGPQAPGFKIDNVQVLIKVDLALLSSDKKFNIFDWKTGKLPSFPSGQINQSEFQIYVYQLWPHKAFGHPLDSITAHLVYVSINPPHEKNYDIDQNLREYAMGLLRRSVTRIEHFCKSHGEGRLGLNNLDFALLPGVCLQCSFKRLCQRMIEDGR